MKIQLSEKQQEYINLMHDPQILDLLIGGSAGGAKTFSMALGIAMFAHIYPGIHIALGRKTLKALRQSTVATLVSKVHPAVGIGKTDFRYSTLDNEIIYKNGSKVTMIELDNLPSDPDFARFGSLEFDWAFIDEAGEITLQAKDVLRSRLGRGTATKQYHLTPKLVLSCNPAVNFLRNEYYNPYKKMGGGNFQKWRIGDVIVNGNVVPAYRAFLRISVMDNPFIDRNYINTLRQMPSRQRKRLLEGNWDFADNEKMLFPGELLDEVILYMSKEELDEEQSMLEKADIRIGVDVADVGADSNVISVLRGGVLIEQEKFNLHYLKSNQEIAIGEEVAKRVIRKAKKLGLTERDAKRICVEVNGVGASARDFLRKAGWRVTEYSAKTQTRSNMYYSLNQLMTEGKIKILNDQSYIDVPMLREQLAPHEYEMQGDKPKVIAKKMIKQILGCSPDLADSFAIATYPLGSALELPEQKTISRVYTGGTTRSAPSMSQMMRNHPGIASFNFK